MIVSGCALNFVQCFDTIVCTKASKPIPTQIFHKSPRLGDAAQFVGTREKKA